MTTEAIPIQVNGPADCATCNEQREKMPPIRCGDTVLHRPTGETWLVAYVEDNDLSGIGWPEGIARRSDCELIERCTDEEHAYWIDVFRKSRSQDSFRTRAVLRLYGTPEEQDWRVPQWYEAV